MIVQPIGADKQLIYVSNYETDYKTIGSMLGICSMDGTPQNYATVRKSGFTNSNGVRMPAWELGGKTMTAYVVNDHSEPFRDAVGMVNALNYFHRPTFIFEKFSFTGKFSTTSPYMVYDSMHRGISLNEYNVKDLRGIHGIMTNLGVNNGKLFEPLIARYVYSCRQVSRKRLQVTGYFDLEEYLRTIHDDSSKLFTVGHTNALIYVETGNMTTINVSSVKDGVANVSIVGGKSILDMKRANAFKPYVIFSQSPLIIRNEMNFQWTRVTFDGMTIFMTPMMTKPDAWGTLQGGIDLLSPFFGK